MYVKTFFATFSTDEEKKKDDCLPHVQEEDNRKNNQYGVGEPVTIH